MFLTILPVATASACTAIRDVAWCPQAETCRKRPNGNESHSFKDMPFHAVAPYPLIDVDLDFGIHADHEPRIVSIEN